MTLFEDMQLSKVLEYNQSQVKAFLIDGEPWFLASDVAKVLDYSRARDMIRLLEPDEKGAHKVRGLEGTRQVEREVSIISESGLYHAIFASSKPDAQAFRKWVTSEVLPAIRKNGQYTLRREHKYAEEVRDAYKTRYFNALDEIDRLRAEKFEIERELDRATNPHKITDGWM